ncbi:YicC family protein [Ornithinibacillus sp. L9]|uniref:YicC family protein n=1 Tax=Ornithinibacillus caprae TaxID=2678566 RepID=A0A6N8FIR0_9BACI|nr:YicC/YloC family endoribonuclease [Ornithinibacillus caprae]MUK89490.1 YicC family protein [Ornithinibacillus caprae]
MVMSMTGYGRESIEMENTTITVEIRTVNHRFLDFTPKIPRSLLYLEDKIKKVAQSHFNRGRIEVFISIEGEKFVQKKLHTDWELMDQFFSDIQEARNRYQLSGEIPVTMLTSIPELITLQENDSQPTGLQEAIIQSIEKACIQVNKRRLEEGQFLSNDILERVKTIRSMVLLLETRRSEVIEEYRSRIHSRIEEYIDESPTVDANRIHQEIAILAEKGDITEEITRLLSHLNHFEELMKTDEPIGRKLDFILQEMHRETNTIGSKSTDSQIGEWTVSLKSDIEKIKEQIQNIE